LYRYFVTCGFSCIFLSLCQFACVVSSVQPSTIVDDHAVNSNNKSFTKCFSDMSTSATTELVVSLWY